MSESLGLITSGRVPAATAQPSLAGAPALAGQYRPGQVHRSPDLTSTSLSSTQAQCQCGQPAQACTQARTPGRPASASASATERQQAPACGGCRRPRDSGGGRLGFELPHAEMAGRPGCQLPATSSLLDARRPRAAHLPQGTLSASGLRESQGSVATGHDNHVPGSAPQRLSEQHSARGYRMHSESVAFGGLADGVTAGSHAGAHSASESVTVAP